MAALLLLGAALLALVLLDPPSRRSAPRGGDLIGKLMRLDF